MWRNGWGDRCRTVSASFDIPIIYLTAYADEDTLQRAKITEPYGYIVKPFKERELHITIDMALYKHEMEKKLKESEKWLATTLRSIGDAVIATDRHGLVTFMNAVAESLMGWKLEEVLNKRLIDVFHIINKDTRQPVENPVTRVLFEGNIVGLANHTHLIAKNGMEIPIDDSAAPIKDDKENITGVILVFRDVTEREKAEEELRKAHDELEARVVERTAELKTAVDLLQEEVKMRQKAEEELRVLNDELEARVRERTVELEVTNKELESFSYSVAHDLKTPIRAMEGFSRILMHEHADKLDAEALRLLRIICDNTKRMSRLIDDLLGLSRLTRQPMRKSVIHLGGMAEEVFVRLKSQVPKRNLQLTVKDLPEAYGDHSLLYQVMMNILDNAIKYTRPREIASIEVGGRIADNENIYSFKDNGIGFDERYADSLFVPFQRLHGLEEYEGTGIGLAIVKRIIQKHSGRVWAEGKVGAGAIFYFALPENV